MWVMSLQKMVLGALCVVLLAVGWSFRRAAWLQELLHPEPVKPLNIPFDNGSVRDKNPPAAPTGAALPTQKPPGVLRKCVGREGVIYSDNVCPPGSKEASMGQGTLNVVNPVRPAARPASAPVAPVEAEPTLRERRIQQILDKNR